jgi:hypothetical protein
VRLLGNDFNIVAEGGNETHEPIDREPPESAMQQSRYFRLVDTEDFGGLGLCHMPLFDNAGDSAYKAGLGLVFLWAREPKVSKVIATLQPPSWLSSKDHKATIKHGTSIVEVYCMNLLDVDSVLKPCQSKGGCKEVRSVQAE